MSKDNVTGIVLDIPPTVLQNIENADKAIKDLEQTSKKAAQNIKRDFDTTMVSGVEAFIKKVQEAQSKLGNLKMPTIDASGLSAAIQALSQAMATIDKSATTGSNRLGRIADAMTKLQTANPNPQMFQTIADGIAKIGNTSQQTIDNVRNLSQMMAQLARDIRTVQQAQSAQSANTATAAQYNKLFKEQADLVRRINEVKAKGADADGRDLTLLDKMRARYDEINQQLDKLNRKKQTAASELARTQGYNRVGDAQARTDAAGTINYAKQAKSLNDLQAAYKNLKAVMATVDPKTAAWQQMNTVLGQTRTRIDEIKKKMGEFKSHVSQVGDVAGQLKRTLAATFSISAIHGYINKLIETRAQFELQQTALRAILQDKQKADEIFQQVQQMALQSPFSIMQMTTFTKQLAAYRIESEKLVGTTKMLADVSAGLGVDMGRLILAYGQVKAANYLRATEVRQFTEAGLNIAGELATYFSELQGKMISVGDVMEMITKRMVRFEDVEEVFKRVTSAGGLFYDMQKKQSETLWGQLQRINDAMSVMFNEIGKSNQGAISTILTTIRALISNWRTLAIVIQTAAAALGTFFVATKVIPSIIAGYKTLAITIAMLTTRTHQAAAAQRMLGATNPYAVLATAAVGLGVAIWQAVTAQSALNEEMDRISEESSKDMWDLIFKFREGAEAVRDTTKSYDERKKALEDLQNTFRGILPDQDLEYDNIIKITDGYKSATEAIKAYSAEKAKQATEEAINTEKQKQWTDFIENSKGIVAPLLKGAFTELSGADEASLKGLVGNIMMQIQQEVEEGSIKSGQAAYDRFIEILNSRFKGLKGSDYGNLQEALKGVFNVDNHSTAYIAAFQDASILWKQNFADMLTYAQDKQQEFAKQYQVVSEGMTQQDIDNFEHYKILYELRAKVLEDFQAKLLAYQEARQKGDIDAQGNATNEAGEGRIADLEKATGELNRFLFVTGEATISWQNLRANTGYETDALIYFDEVQKRVLGSFLQNIINAGGNRTIVNWAEETNKSLRNAGFQEMQIDIANTAKRWGVLSGVSSAVMNKLKIDANTNYTSAAKDAKALATQSEENIFKITQTTIAIIEMGRKAGQAINFAQARAQAEKQWGTTIEDEQKIVKWASELAKLWGQIDKSTSKVNKKSSRQKDIWTPRLNLMQKVNKEYEKLLKYYSKEEAMARIRTSYGDAVAETFKGTQWADISKWGTFDAQATVDRLKELAEKAGKDAKKKILEAAGTLQAEIDIKIEEKNIQDAKNKIQELFDNYELTKTLGGLGLNIDLTYLVGGKPVKLEDLRKQLEAELSAVKATGGEEDTLKAYEEALKKVTNLENKAAVERLKNYYKYMLEATSDRVQLELKAQEQIRKIRADETLTDETKQYNIDNVNKKLQEDLSKLAWKEFQGSDMYINMFADLESASSQAIDMMLDKLESLRGSLKNLPADQVRAIVRQMEQLRDIKIQRNPFKGFIDNAKEALKYLKERKRIEDDINKYQRESDTYKYQIDEQEKLVYNLQMQYDAAKNNKNISAEELAQLKSRLDVAKQMLATLKATGAVIKDNLDSAVDKQTKGNKAVDNLLKGFRNIRKEVEDYKERLNGVVEGLDSMGVLSESFIETWEGGMDVLDNAMNTVESAGQAVADYYSGNFFGAVKNGLSAVGSLFKTIGGWFNFGDKKKERQIKRLQEHVEKLQKAYEKLGDEIKRAYEYNDYKAGYEQSLKNLEEQKKAIQEQINLEKSKKHVDEDKVKEYEDALEKLAEDERELRNQFYEDWGSYGDDQIKSAGEDFVSVWLDAFKETGDGLDALNGKWDEFFENLIMRQAASAVVNRKLKKYIDRINAVLDSSGLSEAETAARMKEIIDAAKNEASTMNEQLKNWFSALGIKGGQGDLLLSDLQKGIQNITEPQAAAIEAYLNSMRFAVFEQNNILTQMLTAIQAQYGTSADNPILSEVKAIRSLVSDIDNKLSKVIVNRNSTTGNYIMKVG